MEKFAIALQLDRENAWRICRTVNEIRNAMDEGIFACVMHMEGCEAIGADLAALDVFLCSSLRSHGPVWSRHNIFGHGRSVLLIPCLPTQPPA